MNLQRKAAMDAVEKFYDMQVDLIDSTFANDMFANREKEATRRAYHMAMRAALHLRARRLNHVMEVR